MTESTSLRTSFPLADYESSKSELDEAIRRVLAGGQYILGPEVTAFEQEFGAWLGGTRVIGVANGTDALVLALKSLGIGPGDQVVTVSHTAVATVAAIEWVGARPILIDIEPDTFCLDPAKLDATLNGCGPDRPKAVIVVHLYGHPAPMPAILEIARKHGLFVVEDCAQAHGARLQQRCVGTWGDVAAFSFYPTKNLGAIGDGGAVATRDAERFEQIRQLREYGWKLRYVSELPGGNSRLDELQAAVLRVKCRRLLAANERRRELARAYDEGFVETAVTPPPVRGGVEHAFHQYVVRVPERDRLRSHLTSRGIPCAVHYPQAVHQQPAYRGRVRIGSGGLTETEKACREILSLPMHPFLSGGDLQGVVQAIKEGLQ